MFNSIKNLFSSKKVEVQKPTIYSSENSNSVSQTEEDSIASFSQDESNISNELKTELLELTEEEIKLYIDYHINLQLNPNFHSLDFNINNCDSLFEDAARIVVMSQQGSASLLQRKLKLGYNRAGRLIDQLESAKIVGGYEGEKSRLVLVPDMDTLNSLLENLSNGIFENPKMKLFYEKYFPIYEDEILKFIDDKIQLEKEKEENLIKESIKNELLEKERKKQLRLQAKKELQQDGLISKPEKLKREHITQEVKDLVWNRDSGKCVECGSNEKLEFDHIIPHIKGGSSTYRNIQLLCESCNREKSAKLG